MSKSKITHDFKRLLSITLALVMLAGMFPVAASADTTVKKDINSVNYDDTAVYGTYYYTGEPVEPWFDLYEGSGYVYDYVVDTKHFLREGVDYVVTYEDNIYPDPDNTYNLKAIITGIGDYYGTMTKKFNFKRRAFDSRLVTVELDKTVYDYTGEPICPKPHVYFNGKELVESQDYVLEYSGNVDVSTSLFGSGHIKVVGINNFTSSTQPESAYFYIAPPVETVDQISRTDKTTGDHFSWSIDEEGLLSLDVRSGSGDPIVIPGQAEGGFADDWDEEARQWIHVPGYGEYSASVRKVKITGDVSVVTGFTNYLFLEDVELPDGVTTIRGNGWGTGSLGGCYNLRHINLPDSLTTIEVNALSHCRNLTVDLPDGITYFAYSNGEAGQRGTKFMVTLNSTTEQTLKTQSQNYYYIKGYPDFNIKYCKQDSSAETYERTLVHYTGTNPNVVIPDFVEAISGSYQNTYSLCPVMIESEVIPGSVKWLDHYLSDESALKYFELKPRALKSLPNNFFGNKFDTVISLPETLETIDEPSNYKLCSDYSWVIAEVVEGSPIHNYVLENTKWKENDGSGVGNRYRIKTVRQPSLDPSYLEVRTDTLADVHASKNDGSFTFDSLLYNGAPLTEGTDYTAKENTITLKEDCLERLGTGTHEFTLHYTGTAASETEDNVITPVDPVWTVNYIPRSVPLLTVTGDGGADITDKCTVVWKTAANVEVPQPVSVSPGTFLRYTITPNDSLKVGGVQYYKTYNGEVTLTERTQEINVALVAQGTVTVTPTASNKTDGTNNIPNSNGNSYNITWYSKDGDNYTKVGEGNKTPMTDVGTVLYCDIIMKGENRNDYPDAVKVPVPITFANDNREINVNAKNNITLNITGEKKNGDNIAAADYTVYWYTKTDDGFAPTGITGAKVLDLAGSVGVDYYYEIAPKDRYSGYTRIFNWTQFHGVPASDKTKVTITDKPQEFDIKLEAVKEVEVTGTVTNGAVVGSSLEITATQNPYLGYTCGASYYSYASEWNKLLFVKTADGNAVNFTALVNDLETTVKAADKNGNFKAAYQTQQTESLDVPFSMTMEDEELPSEINMTIYRQYPVTYGDGYQVYFITDRTPHIFYDMSFTLTNETTGITIDPSLYTVTPQSIKFNDVSALSGIISMHDTLTLSANIPANDLADANEEAHPVHAVPVRFTDSVNVSRNYGDANNKFELSYKEYGQIRFKTTNKGNVDVYALYDSNGDIADTGEGWAGNYICSAQVTAGQYTLAVWKKAGWLNPPEALADLQSLLDESEYQTASVLVEDGRLSATIDLGTSNDLTERKLFDDSTGFQLATVETTANTWTPITLDYKVDTAIAHANPDNTYAITVMTSLITVQGINAIIPRYQNDHRYNVPMKDKYISVYANGKLTDSTVKVIFHDGFHMGDVRGFTVYTDQPEGKICFEVRADSGGEYTITANGDRMDAQGKKKQTAAVGSMVVSATSENTTLNFTSDYLRTTDNSTQGRNAYNSLWFYAEQSDYNIACTADVYMDDVKIGTARAGSGGLKMFTFMMDENKVGSANTSEFKSLDSDWSLYGNHKLYAIIRKGDKETHSAAAYMECVPKSSFTPAFLTNMTVTTLTDYEEDPFNGRSYELFEKQYSVNYIYILNNFFCPGDKGNVFSYEYTAEVEDAENLRDNTGLILFVTAQDGTEYSAAMERVDDTNTFKATISDERLLPTSWAVSVNSKLPETKYAPVTNAEDEEAILDALGRDTVIDDPETGERTTVGAYYEKIRTDLENTPEEDIEESLNFIYDVYTEYFRSMQSVYGELPDGWVFDGSQESIDALYKYLGYTFGTAADVDYESWEDYATVFMADGSECRSTAEFTHGDDGNFYYTSYSVVLPKNDEDEGWSQIRRVEIIEDDGDTLPTAKRGTRGGVIMTSGLDNLARWSPATTNVLNNSANNLKSAYKQITGHDHTTSNMAGNIRGQLLNGGGAWQQEGKGAGNYLQQLKNLLEQSDNLPPETVSTLRTCYENAKDINSCHDFGSLLDAGAAAANGMLEIATAGGVKVSKKAIEAVMNAYKAKYGDDIPLSAADAALLAEKLFTQTWASKAEAEIYMDAIAIENALRAAGIRVSGGLLRRSSVRNVSEAVARPTMDPSGIVYEAVLSNPVEGATATLYERTSNGTEVQWNAEDYGQVNPQTTLSNGFYQWYVPEGEWQVRVTAPARSNLQDNTSADHEAANKDDGSTAGWLPVMPVQLGINIPLYSTKSPMLDNFGYTKDSVTLDFSLYMDTSTLNSKTVTITNGNDTIECFLTFPDKETDPMDDTKEYAKKAVVTTTNETGFEKGVTYTLTITSGAKAYNGKALSKTTKTFMVSVDKKELKKVIDSADGYLDTIENGYPEIASKLQTAISAANNVYNKANATEDEMLVAKNDLNSAVETAKAEKIAADKLAADKKSFGQHKTNTANAAGKLAKSNDSAASKKLISDAQKAINALAYDENKTLDENNAAVDAILAKLKTDLENQRKADIRTVRFSTDGGTAINDVTLTTGFKVAKPNDPTKDGFVFDGWFTDSKLTKAFDFDTPVTENITLYAKFTKYTYTDTWEWFGYTRARVTLTCDNDPTAPDIVEEMRPAEISRTEPTCTTDGSVLYQANFDYDGERYTDEKTETLTKTGHAYGEPKWTWDGFSAATATFTCANDKSHTETVNAEITSETTAASCEKDGKTVYIATVIFGGNTYTDTKTETIKKLGHTYGNPEWTWNGYDKATATFTCANDKSHTETVNAEITSETTAATCEKDGKTVYTATVTFGGNTYTDTKTETLAKIGHKWSEPEFEWDGSQYQETCKATFTCLNDKEHTQTIDATVTSETIGTVCDYEVVVVFTATVTFEGKTYTDTDTIYAVTTGHEWGQPEWTWNGYQTAFAVFTCANDKSHTETVNAKIASETTAATCEKDGKTVYTATITFGDKTYTDTKTETIKKTGHSYKVTAWDWDGFDKAAVTLTCEHDKSHTKTIDAKITSEAKDDGTTVYTATAELDGKTYTDTKTREPVGILGDVNGDGTVDSADALMILRNSVGLESFGSDQTLIGDVNGDGTVDSADALEVLRSSVSLSSGDKIGKPIAA